MKKESGITLVALVLTIVVLIIIGTISIRSGTESIDNTRLKGFYMQLEIVQKRVDDIATTNETYIDSEGNTIYLKEQGSVLTEEQTTSLNSILEAENITAQTDDFKYFTVQDLKEKFDLTEIEYNVFVNFEKRIVIAENGIQIGDKMYYTLKNTTYFVEQNTEKNTGTIESLEYKVLHYTGDTYKVKITPSNTIGDLDKSGYIKYKKTTTKYWETTSDTEIIIEFNTEYNIIFIDQNNNSIEKTIKIEYVKDEEGNVIVDEEGNNKLNVVEINEQEESEEI